MNKGIVPLHPLETKAARQVGQSRAKFDSGHFPYRFCRQQLRRNFLFTQFPNSDNYRH